jgi:hypothetical protein
MAAKHAQNPPPDEKTAAANASLDLNRASSRFKACSNSQHSDIFNAVKGHTMP